MYKQETKVVYNMPPGMLGVEDSVAMMRDVQRLALENKANNLSQYGGPDYDAILKALGSSITMQLEAQKQFLDAQKEASQ